MLAWYGFDAPPTEQLEHVTVEAMKKAGIDPGIIYAFEQTGLLVTEDNEHLLSEADLAEWEAALDEYDAMPGHTSPPEFPFGTIALYGPDDQRTTKIALVTGGAIYFVGKREAPRERRSP